MDWLKHAFAIEAPGPAEPTDEQRPVVERFCREIVRRGLTPPSLLFLEMCRPLNFVAAQAIHFFSPVLSVFTDRQAHAHLAAFLERRGSVDWLCDRITELAKEPDHAGPSTIEGNPH
ncbi:MAG: hypothetical protein ACF8TS_18695 [Maioricimonas sp. JB049]